MVKVSVIIPTYNRARIVGDAINSALAQTLCDIEAIIVDDGSTDETRGLAERISDHRVTYVHKQNGGAASARNLGLDMARGQYIAFLDSDDIWPADFLEKMIARIEASNEYGLAYCPIIRENETGFLDESNVMQLPSGWVTAKLFARAFIYMDTVVVKSDCVRELRFDAALATAEDSDFLLRLSLLTQFAYVPDIAVTVRSVDHSLTKSAGINCNRILSLERFYWQVKDRVILPNALARRKLSHAYRAAAVQYHRTGLRYASLLLYHRAIAYWPVDGRLYVGFARAFLSSRSADPAPKWMMPPALPEISVPCVAESSVIGTPMYCHSKEVQL